MTGFEVLALGGLSGMQMVGMAVSMAGTVMSAMGTIAAGKAQAAQATAAAQQNEYQAKQLEARGKWEQAQGRAKADLAKRRKMHALSRAQTVGAAGGFMFGDHTSSIAIADLERWGSFDEFSEQAMAQGARWDNSNLANAQRYEATLNRMEASSAKSSAGIGAMATLIGGAGSMFGKYGGGGGTGGTMVSSGISRGGVGSSYQFLHTT